MWSRRGKYSDITLDVLNEIDPVNPSDILSAKAVDILAVILNDVHSDILPGI